MKSLLSLLTVSCITLLHSLAAVVIDEDTFGRSLGGWAKRDKGAAEYPLSGSVYRTYKPEISPTPDGGIFVSVRIDNVRGWLSTDDHAVLEITVSPKGAISSAQSSIAIQGKSIKSEMILGGNEGGKAIFSTEGAVRIGTDLVADLSAKLLRENIVEAGRVSFPAALRHNYNRLFQAIRVDGNPIQVVGSAAKTPPITSAQTPSPEPAKPQEPTKPDAAPAKPDAAPAKPEEAPAKSEEAPAKPDETPAKPEESPPPAAIPVPETVPVPEAVPLQVKPYN